MDWAANVIAIGALAGLTTVVLVLMLGQSRIVFAMSRDGLLPRSLAAVDQKRGTPAKITIGVGVVVACLWRMINLTAITWVGDGHGSERSSAAGPGEGGSSQAPDGNDPRTP